MPLPSTHVASDSQQISAYWEDLPYDDSLSILFLQYRDLSRQVVTLSGTYESGTNDWHWRDYTNTLDQIMERSYQALSNRSTLHSSSTLSRLSDLNIAQPCNGHGSRLNQSTSVFTMTCFLTNSFLAMFSFFPHSGSQHNATLATDVFYVDLQIRDGVSTTKLTGLESPTLRNGSSR